MVVHIANDLASSPVQKLQRVATAVWSRCERCI